MPTDKPLVTFHVEPWDQFRDEAGDLWQDHWQEVALDKDAIPLSVAHEQYDAMDDAGQLCIVVARHNGAIIGYWLGIIRPHLHYSTSLTAYTDIYFVDMAFRKNGTGQRLFLAVEKELKRRGVQRIFTATKKHLDHSALFLALGYRDTETTFTKLIP